MAGLDMKLVRFCLKKTKRFERFKKQQIASDQTKRKMFDSIASSDLMSASSASDKQDLHHLASLKPSDEHGVFVKLG